MHHNNLSIAVDSPWVNNIPTIYNNRAMQKSIMLSTPTESSGPSQPSAVWIVGDNVSMPHSQGMNITNTETTLESLEIPYNNN